MTNKSISRLFLLAISFILFALLAFNLPGNDDDQGSVEEGGLISLGTEENLLTQVIGPEGGKISISDPDSPLDGFEIEISAETYETEIEFSVGYQEVVDHQLGSDFYPLTPLIHVDNGANMRMI